MGYGPSGGRELETPGADDAGEGRWVECGPPPRGHSSFQVPALQILHTAIGVGGGVEAERVMVSPSSLMPLCKMMLPYVLLYLNSRCRKLTG